MITSHFPWHQLQELTLLRLEISTVVYCLKACPDLTRLRCQLYQDGYYSSASRIERSSPLVHHNLLTLETLEDSAKMRLSPDNVLDYLELPALQALTLSIPCRKDHPDDYLISDQSFPNFISRSQCKLETLSLEWIQMKKTNVMLFSSLVPTLTTLKLTENRICIYGDLLELLAAVDGDNNIFPELQHLEYNFYARSIRDSDYHMIFTGLVPVVKARWEMVNQTDAVRPLQSMKIRGARPCRELDSFVILKANVGKGSTSRCSSSSQSRSRSCPVITFLLSSMYITVVQFRAHVCVVVFTGVIVFSFINI